MNVILPKRQCGRESVKHGESGFLARSLLPLLILASAFCVLPSANAGLREPDTLVVGNVVVKGRPATNASVVVQIRKTMLGTALASYPMGSTPGDASYYALAVQRNTEPAPDSDEFKSGDQLLVVLLVDGMIVAIERITLASAGEPIRVDFGSDIDTNGNGLPDRWEDIHPAGDLDSDLDGDGMSKRAEFLTGTNPDDGSDVFSLSVKLTNQVVRVTFEALRAEGIGYYGLERRYALDRSTNLIGGAWEPVTGFDSILGANQVVEHSELDLTNSPAFFRARVSLSQP